MGAGMNEMQLEKAAQITSYVFHDDWDWDGCKGWDASGAGMELGAPADF